MKRSVLDPRSLILAPIVLFIGYLVSLPVYYFGIVWRGGLYAFYIENTYISVFGLIGFFGFRWLDKICKDDGSGNLYACSILLILFVILFCFRGNVVYAANIAELFYPEGLNQSVLSFDDGLTMETLVDLMRFSSVYICTYAASCFLLLAMFCRSKWNKLVSAGIGQVKLRCCKNVEREIGGEDGEQGEEAPLEDDFKFEDDIMDKDFEEMMNEDMEAAEDKGNVIRCVGEIRGRRPDEKNGESFSGDHIETEDGTKENVEKPPEADRNADR